jgi:hypothetical protein
VVTVNDLNIPKLARGGFLLPMDGFDGKWEEYNQTILRGIASLRGQDLCGAMDDRLPARDVLEVGLREGRDRRSRVAPRRNSPSS